MVFYLRSFYRAAICSMLQIFCFVLTKCRYRDFPHA